MRIWVCCALVACVALVSAVYGQSSSKTDAEAIVGTWAGTVKADRGEMKITVKLTESSGVVSGTIENPHGTFKIKRGTLEKGTWTLPFETDQGAKGTMKGKVDGDTFAGDWDFSPTAVGTFEVTRVKT